jgi:hypothetical protein
MASDHPLDSFLTHLHEERKEEVAGPARQGQTPLVSPEDTDDYLQGGGQLLDCMVGDELIVNN